MARLYRVMIRCPKTGKSVDTGVTTLGREVLNTSVFTEGRLGCPHCSGFHSYEENAYLDVEIDQSAEDAWRPNP